MRNAALTWPPEYSVRVSNKAKYARLRILPHSGLEVVLPRGLSPDTATAIVENHKDWICKTLPAVYSNDYLPSAELPQTILLNGGAVALPVAYGMHGAAASSDVIPIRARWENAHGAAKELQAWAHEYARQTLGAIVAEQTARYGMRCSGLRFRRQKSRWGSCTALGSLSLNTCLIFLPEELACHVILHELAHTRHMDHGEGFWKTLFAMEPQALALDKRLRKAWRYVPGWIWL